MARSIVRTRAGSRSGRRDARGTYAPVDDGLGDMARAPRPVERLGRRQRLVQHHAEGPEVGGGRGRLALQPLGRQVGGRAQQLAGDGEVRPLPWPVGDDALGDAEVGDLGRPVVGDEDVAGLDVPVDDARVVGRGQGRRARRRPRRGASPVDGAGGDAVGQRLAREPLHDDVGHAVVLAGVEDGDRVGMGQAGGGPCLGLEPGADVVARRTSSGRRNLDRDRPVERRSMRVVDVGHPAPAQDARHLVATGDDCAGAIASP